MKNYCFLLLALFGLSCNSNKNPESTEAKTANTTSSPGNEASSDEITGQWKRTAAGQDANNNRILDEAEKTPLEPAAQDNLDFYEDKKCKVHGMGMELEGTYAIKNENGKGKIFIYTKDETPDDESAMKFEIVSAEPNTLVLIPPIYAFMLAVYTKVK